MTIINGELRIVFVLIGLVVCGCAGPRPRAIEVPQIRFGGTPIPLKAPPAKMRLPELTERLFPWMALDLFYPPGCTPITPANYRPTQVIETPRAWFPSTDECTSPNGTWTLFHLGNGHGQSMDYVICVRNNNTKAERPLFQTQKVMEVLWSQDSSWVAVTVLTGSNSSSVVLLGTANMKVSEPLATQDALDGFLSPYLIESSQFIMALGWTERGQLILRARGIATFAPFELFGYELLVNPNRLGFPDQMMYLRGYINGRNPSAK